MNKAVISAKGWSSRLKGKDAATKFRALCISRLGEHKVLTVNMAGVKHISEGFAFECFGPLYLECKKRGGKLRFVSLDEDLSPVLISGVNQYVRFYGDELRAADSVATA